MKTGEAANLREVIRRHAAVFDTQHQAVIGTTLDGEIVYWNAIAEKLYGWKADEVEGKPILDVTPTESSREQAATIMARLKEGRSWSGTFNVRNRAGEEISVMVRDVPVKDEAGHLVGVVGISNRSP